MDSRWTLVIAASLCTLWPTSTAYADGKLDRAGEAMRQSETFALEPDETKSERAKTRERREQQDKYNREEAAGAAAFAGVLGLLGALFGNSTSGKKRDFSSPNVLPGYAPYPFADGHPGHARQLSCGSGPCRSRDWALQLSLEGGYDWRAVGVIGGGIRIQTPTALELEGRYYHFREHDAKEVDRAFDGRTLLWWRAGTWQRVSLRFGAGLRHWKDVQGWVHGFVVPAGLEFFAGRRAIGRIEFSWGRAGHAWFVEPRATLGFAVKRLEVFVGFNRNIFFSPVNRRLNVGIGGPIIGVRGWM